GIERTLWIGIGAVIGAQLGAKLSSKVKSEWILNSLAVALGIAGLRIAMSALS
ncbi:MAG: sulfite exporter TauE/SafE family protein, partial [Leptonema sp. (in: Bacteria)]|nr:sulfite exporter TauE/SafE family protein [Leptonema sp. (in: bacteria)]